MRHTAASCPPRNALICRCECIASRPAPERRWKAPRYTESKGIGTTHRWLGQPGKPAPESPGHQSPARDVRGAGDEPGSTYVLKRGPGAARTNVLEAERPRRLMTRPDAYLGLQFDVVSELAAEGDGTRLKLWAETHWPRGSGLSASSWSSRS